MTRLRSTSLLNQLRQHPRIGGAGLCVKLGGISRATLTRGLKGLGNELISGGGSRRIRYAARRSLRGDMSDIPVFRVDEHGRGREAGLLSPVYPNGSFLKYREPFLWPLDRDMADGWFESLPYPLIDQRPQGFLGRNFARAHTLDLGVSPNPEEWSDDDIAYVLSMTGHDQPGDLILGEVAYRRFLGHCRSGTSRFIPDDIVEQSYLNSAEVAVRHGEAGSSAGGEFPKFTAGRCVNGRNIDVIVKFSGADDSSAVRRWSDLLVCEHLASKIISAELGIPAASTNLYRWGGRTFLEVERFDRHGNFGRSPVCTLASLNSALVGIAGRPWPAVAGALRAQGWTDEATVSAINLIWWFGKLIANTDMHDGNLAFRPGLVLAPLYDMLPMGYAPLRGGELPAREFSPELPLPSEAAVWHRAALSAGRYWHTCAADPRISSGFRKICEENARKMSAPV